MKLAALCCTYLRPEGLGQLIECFLRQDYPRDLRQLVILDDAGQYENQSGDGWRLASIPTRFRSLGEKRNSCAALASPDVEGFLVADDDDIYFPHWFRTQAESLRRADWSHPGLVLVGHGDGLRECDTGGLYHGGWAFRRDAFYRVRGYGPHNNGEDQELADRLVAAGATQCDPCEFAPPFYIYRFDNGSYHLSYMDDNGYRELRVRDALSYAKNGHRPQLLEHLAEVFPRHIQIHYGRYRREELFEAARRSRACAYLADDDHGPLALQEILLAGCPTVGVRTGASFVRDGVTGYIVERLPPGRQCVASCDDEAALAIYLDAVHKTATLDRRNVRFKAASEFGTKGVVDRLIVAVDDARTVAHTPSVSRVLPSGAEGNPIGFP